MATNYLYDGAVLEYVAVGTVSSGDLVVIKNMIGVLLNDGVSGDLISAAIEGVWTLPKVTAAVFVQGEELFYDVSVGKFDDSSATAATGDITGSCIATKAGANAETTCEVKINVGLGDITA